MQDKELYQHILGQSSPRGAKFSCPECPCDCPIHDQAAARHWKHLDSCQFKVLLIAAPPRVKCPTHGAKNASLTWADKGSRFTILFERFAIDVLQAAHTIKGAQGILRTRWDETWHILEKAVARRYCRKSCS